MKIPDKYSAPEVKEAYESGYSEGYDHGYAYAEEYFSADADNKYNEGFDEGYALKEIEEDTYGFVKILARHLGIVDPYKESVLAEALAGNAGARYHIVKTLGEPPHG